MGDIPPPAPKPESRVKRIAAAALEASLITALTFGLIAGSAFAAKGGAGSKPSGGGGSSSLTLVALDSSTGVPSWGQRITFQTSGAAYPVVSLTCSQGGNVVYGDSRPLYQPNAFNDPGIFYLSSMSWTSGAADCTASLKGTSHGRAVTLGSTTFHVNA